MKKLILFICACVIANIAASQSVELKKLAKFMQGSYDNSKQAKADTNFFGISLKIIPIWKARTDGFWFYVEQAVSSKLDKPYRQRVYHLTEPANGKFESAVYTLSNPLRFAGKINEVEKLIPDSLIARDGCSVFLQFAQGKKYFKGTTDSNKCPSDLKGAKYATSEVSVYKNQLISWDRGYDADAKQVWGSTMGPYIFKKKK